MGRKKLKHTKRKYRIKYSQNRYLVTEARVNELPERGSARQMAIVLGVSPFVLYGWIKDGLVVSRRCEQGPYCVLKEDLVWFLVLNGIFRKQRERGEYDG